MLKWITSPVSCKDLGRAQPDPCRIHIHSNSSYCDRTPNVAVEGLAHRFAFMSVQLRVHECALQISARVRAFKV
jgi:hypothetical protein